ncbi:MAG TPA: class I SAM-dependent methyltransferase, partial [Hyphomicrobiales bacterium]|nr:class I SAM-dependent methyltransferase [Hyphomicrobiales bacterium]
MLFWRKAWTARKHDSLIDAAEHCAAAGDFGEALLALRQLPLESFGELLLEVPANRPALGRMLPSMASDDVQRHWTGASGQTLMTQSLDFVRSVDKGCRQYLGHGIAGRVLDYGCGWGRLLRLLPWYVDPEQIYGADPWNTSLATCRQHNCPGHLAECDYVPHDLPFGATFDLIYAFSVFTHLSEKTADAVLRVLRANISDAGMLVITIRPPAYWNAHTDWRDGSSKQAMLERHQREGFAFVPHDIEPVNGDITYGDTSMTLDFIRRRWPQWRIAGTTHNA